MFFVLYLFFDIEYVFFECFLDGVYKWLCLEFFLFMQDNLVVFFVIGNVVLLRKFFLKVGNLFVFVYDGFFDVDFSEYGWEDFELGGKNC